MSGLFSQISLVSLLFAFVSLFIQANAGPIAGGACCGVCCTGCGTGAGFVLPVVFTACMASCVTTLGVAPPCTICAAAFLSPTP
jgi:hypothetical protein